ncbi:hypothetical protein DFS34DRAFT_613987 [Phlyctochytrium arcticum]|nr:hypothetical protein DFS34DRAFT_613987 [Phlyctochytrium arcticum]
MGVLRTIHRKIFGETKSDQGEDGRDQWPSRTAFVLAAMSSAIGLGNLLRFPGVVFNAQAGIAFFIPYLLGLFCVGLPILALELILGQTSRSGDVTAFNKIHRRLRGIGAGSAHTSYMVGLYYSVIIAWVTVYFVRCFQTTLPWAGGLTSSGDYFNNEILQAVAQPGMTRNIVGATFTGGLVVWAFIYLAIWKGVLTAGRVVQVTMTLPSILVIVLLVRGVTLPNAAEGIKLYFGTFDATKLANGSVWVEAVSHIFFSIGIGTGVMTAYASYNSKHQDAVQDALIIGLSNSMFEVICGFTVFGVIGFLGAANVKGFTSTFGLGFIAYPVALASMPVPQFWNAIFFFTLFLLGIGSAFSLVEAASTTIKDSRKFNKFSGPAVPAVLCVIGVTTLGLYASDIGILALDSVDTFINSIAMVFLGLMKAWAASTWYQASETCQRTSTPAFLLYNAGWMLGPILGTVIGYASGSLALGLALGFGIWALLFLLGCALAFKHAGTPAIHDLILYQSITFMNDMNTLIRTGTQTRIPLFYPLLIKYVTTPALTIIQVVVYEGVMKKTEMPMAWLGLIIALMVPAWVLLGAIYPNALNWLIPAPKVVDTFDPDQITDGTTTPHVDKHGRDEISPVVGGGGGDKYRGESQATVI